MEKEKIYLVELKIKSRKYYLVDYDFNLSMTKENAMIFTNEKLAYQICGILEEFFEREEAILSGNVIKTNIYELFSHDEILLHGLSQVFDEHKK